ncbi:MAG: CarD family transcriptional regulator [Clostridiales bacterium]|jgi:CarD family transcriptional regulator|nr:CarD family transcriptional regulator [Clostridiales bacterium]
MGKRILKGVIIIFNEGDKISYPMNGAGVIEKIERKKILGEVHEYYILNIPIGNLKLMIPTDNAQEIGVRKVVTEEEADEVMEYFKNISNYEECEWNKRYRENAEKLKKGILVDVAYIAKTLYLRDRNRPLSTTERKMFLSAKNILLSELALVKENSCEELEKILFEDAV